jgi:hypothetical protein
VVVGACSFLAVLVVSALWDAGIRWLHFFQAWMYVATIVLASASRLSSALKGFWRRGLGGDLLTIQI